MFHADRAAAMTALFLEYAGGRLTDKKLAKLQYLAERTSLLALLSPMVNDKYVSLVHGPCLSATLNYTVRDLVGTPDPAIFLWDELTEFLMYDDIRNKWKENTVLLKSRVQWESYLSVWDRDVIEALSKQFKSFSWGQMHDWCVANCREYVQVEKKKVEPISLEAIFLADGNSPKVAKQKANEVRYHERFESEFGYQKTA